MADSEKNRGSLKVSPEAWELFEDEKHRRFKLTKKKVSSDTLLRELLSLLDQELSDTGKKIKKIFLSGTAEDIKTLTEVVDRVDREITKREVKESLVVGVSVAEGRRYESLKRFVEKAKKTDEN
jgi:hypothetical protein